MSDMTIYLKTVDGFGILFDAEVGQYQLIHEDPDLISFYRWCRENGWQPIPNSVLTCLNRGICRYEKRTH